MATSKKSKCQMISKGLCGILGFFQKTNELSGKKLNSFVRFLEETSAWKNYFEFVWPLAQQIRQTRYHIRPLETWHMCSTLHACSFTIVYIFFCRHQSTESLFKNLGQHINKQGANKTPTWNLTCWSVPKILRCAEKKFKLCQEKVGFPISTLLLQRV